jgi:UDP-N-acetyl-D-galactosamine dehydrogenase
MGITFKEDVADIRNSKVVDLIHELEDYSMTVDVIDPHASAEEVKREYNIEVIKEVSHKYDAVVLAVSHSEFKKLNLESLSRSSTDRMLVFDVKGVLSAHENLDYLKL